MCGIVGYLGPRPAAPVLLQGLRRLEYRGYDSAGMAIASDGQLDVRKAAGKLDRLVELVDGEDLAGTTGIGHTRWATHGSPTDINAHPHLDQTGDFAIVHNGIIENFQGLKEELAAAGHTFTSETDTEVLAHLIAAHYEGDLAAAVRAAVARATGAYALVAMTTREPGRVVAARLVSPLVVGLGEGEMFLASGIPALLDHTRSMMVIEDGELVDLTADGVTVEKLDGTPVDREITTVEWDVEQAEKGGYPHFMLKEIFEQPAVLTETMLGRLAGGQVDLEGIGFSQGFAEELDKIWVTACGTAFHAGLVAKEVFEGVLRLPTEVVYAHELRYRNPIITPSSLTVAISQSGETVDTLAAARLAQELGSRLLAVTNVAGSALTHYADDVVFTRAGPEIAVASTKAYLAMLAVDYLLAMHIGRLRGLGSSLDEMTAEMVAIPQKVEAALKQEEEVREVARHLAGRDDIYFIGRGLDYAVATEGSLKLKEISYLHSEAMPAGELKHGTLALVTEGTPVVVVATQQHVYDKTLSALMEVKARGARVIALVYEDDDEIVKFSSDVLRVPRTLDVLSPMVAMVPLQLLAYHVAERAGHDIDQPRNLAKSVTVE